MKPILRLAGTIALTFIIAAPGFAIIKPNTKLKLIETIERPASKKKLGKSNRHRAGNAGIKRRASTRGVYRLTVHQRRKFYRRLLEIYIN